MDNCIFCKIVNQEIPSTKVYEDERVYAFKDINPAAPIHILIVPKQHIGSVLELTDADAELVGHIHLVAQRLAQELGVAERGFRLVNNCGLDGGQTVFHLHFHLLAGRALQWPPG